MEDEDPSEGAALLQLAVISAATPEKAVGWYRDSGYFT
jgi:hypothetical protein